MGGHTPSPMRFGPKRLGVQKVGGERGLVISIDF